MSFRDKAPDTAETRALELLARELGAVLLDRPDEIQSVKPPISDSEDDTLHPDYLAMAEEDGEAMAAAGKSKETANGGRLTLLKGKPSKEDEPSMTIHL